MADAFGVMEGQAQPLDFPGFAQEFLRRNPAYRRDYESVAADPVIGSAAREEIARRWGLSFPLRAGCIYG
jgi:hypothetical protein